MGIKKYSVYLVVLIVVLAAYFFLNQKPAEPYPYKAPYDVPTSITHWHSYLTIKINGEEKYIPDNIGITAGNIIDTNLASDSGISPVHTHDVNEDAGEYATKGRKIHLESINPSAKPEILTLGYFFKVWGKTFNSTCVLEKCNSGNDTLKMYVNGKLNSDFGHYFMRDGDEILLIFE